MRSIWACDFVVQYTARLVPLSIFVIRQACPFEEKPKCQERRPYRCELDRWLRESMGVRGIPIPYAAPNANAHAERVMRTPRGQVLNHFIFLNVRHLLRVVRSYVDYYNGARPSQAIRAIPDPHPELRGPPPASGDVVALPVLGGLHHDYRRAA